jgi:hypothetical protein
MLKIKLAKSEKIRLQSLLSDNKFEPSTELALVLENGGSMTVPDTIKV